MWRWWCIWRTCAGTHGCGAWQARTRLRIKNKEQPSWQSRHRSRSRAIARLGRRGTCPYTVAFNLRFDLGSQYFQESGEPGRVRWPGGRGDQRAVDMRLVHRDLDVLAARGVDLGGAGWVGIQRLALHGSGGGEQLGAVADGSDRLVGVREMADDFEHPQIEPNVFRGAASGNDQRIVGLGLHALEISV